MVNDEVFESQNDDMEMEFEIEVPEEVDTGRQDRIRRLAKETMRGDHGVGERRRKRLGEDYEDVVNEVRRIRLQGE